MSVWLGKCRRCGTAARFEASPAPPRGTQAYVAAPWGRSPKNDDGSISVQCLCGRGWARFYPVIGSVTATKCGARCLSATGQSCECACGGRNHGANHAA